MRRDGLAVARRYAKWELGDPNWADAIIRAYENPDAVSAELDEAQNEARK